MSLRNRINKLENSRTKPRLIVVACRLGETKDETRARTMSKMGIGLNDRVTLIVIDEIDVRI